MTFNQFKYFYAVCKHRNISKAAEELFISQPSVSIAIKELEEELHEQLFIRNNNKLLLTEAGEKLYEMSEDLLARIALIENSFHQGHGESQLLRIGIFPDLTKWVLDYLEDLIAKLTQKYENLDVEYVEINPDDRDRLLLTHSIDVAFCNDDYPILSVFSSKKVHKTRMKVCMSKDHPLAGEEVISMGMLENEAVIGNYYSDVAWQEWVKSLCKNAETAPKTKYFFRQNSAAHALLVQNKAVCFGRPDVNGMSMDGIVAIPLEPPYEPNIVIVYDNRYAIRNVVADLLKLAKYV